MSKQDHEDLKDRSDEMRAAAKTAGTPKTSANDRQVGGNHYQTGGIQHWDLFGAEYLMGCATKYMRWRKKNGVEDLEKALHYAEKLREGVARTWERPSLNVTRLTVVSWCNSFGLDWVEQTIVLKLLLWNDKTDIDEAIGGIKHLIETERGKPLTPKEVLEKLSPLRIKEKPYGAMTDIELSNELSRLVEAQEKSLGWGAAVGVRAEDIKEIYSEQARRMRRVPRFENEATLKRHEVLFATYGEHVKKGPQFTNEHGTFEVDEMCSYQSNKNTGIFVAKIRGILQDGEAEIDLGEHGHRLVKWNTLSKLPKTAQRTPEDGAQHASVAPWVVLDNWLGKSGIDDPLISMYWTRRAADLNVLEPCVNTPNIPRVLRSCYNLRPGVGWVMDIRKCPPDARGYFPNLIREQNMKEWEDLPEWERGLYEWNEQGNKYVLNQFTDAWHVEAD